MSDQAYEAVAVWSQVAGSVLFAAAIVYLWIRFVTPAVLAAQARKNADLADAEARRDEAVREAAQAQASIANAESDAAAIVARAQRDAAALQARLVGDARAEGERLVRNAGGELERGRAAASEQLRAELLATALRIAREAAAGLDPATDRRLVDEALDTADRAGRG